NMREASTNLTGIEPYIRFGLHFLLIYSRHKGKSVPKVRAKSTIVQVTGISYRYYSPTFTYTKQMHVTTYVFQSAEHHVPASQHYFFNSSSPSISFITACVIGLFASRPETVCNVFA